MLAAGPTAETFTQENLERTFGGVLRNFELSGHALHEDEDARSLSVITDDERPLVFYGVKKNKKGRLKEKQADRKGAK